MVTEYDLICEKGTLKYNIFIASNTDINKCFFFPWGFKGLYLTFDPWNWYTELKKKGGSNCSIGDLSDFFDFESTVTFKLFIVWATNFLWSGAMAWTLFSRWPQKNGFVEKKLDPF